MTTLKEEVAWKITRYVEETAEINTKIQINNEEIKKSTSISTWHWRKINKSTKRSSPPETSKKVLIIR